MVMVPAYFVPLSAAVMGAVDADPAEAATFSLPNCPHPARSFR